MIAIKEKENTLKEKQILGGSISQALSNKYSFSLWKTPGRNQKNLIISQVIKEVDDFILEEGEPGFAFASFLPNSKKYLFPVDYFYQFENEIQVTGTPLASALHPKPTSPSQHPTQNFHFNAYSQATQHDQFIELVTKGLQDITQSKFEKVVPSRCKDIRLENDFDLLDAFYTLCENHPQAMVSLVSSPQTGTWLGATPELLVSVDNQNTFKTIALAGTQPYHSEIDLKTVAWTQKEIEEQALVCRYIINCFKKIRLREYEEHGPRTMVAGNIMHLKTVYEVDMAATNFPQLGSVMLKLLHPTSAVCGMPFEPSLEFLKANEGYDREFYSGYLGPIQVNNNSQIYVNLRCMQLFESHARLYAGAGVTIDSTPEKELEETEIKMQNLQNLVIL
jgi:isochorismate synthase